MRYIFEYFTLITVGNKNKKLVLLKENKSKKWHTGDFCKSLPQGVGLPQKFTKTFYVFLDTSCSIEGTVNLETEIRDTV